MANHPEERYPVGTLVTVANRFPIELTFNQSGHPLGDETFVMLVLGYEHRTSDGAIASALNEKKPNFWERLTTPLEKEWRVVGLIDGQLVNSRWMKDAGMLMRLFSTISSFRDAVG